MNALQTLAALALGSVLVAGCNKAQDPAESTTDTTAPAATPDMPPAPDAAAPIPESGDTMTPSTTDPYGQPTTPATPEEIPPPPNN